MALRSRISGTGLGLPTKVVTNHDLARFVDTSDEWIRTRTGIAERRFLGEGQSLSSICSDGARTALKQAGLDPKDVELIICCTATSETIMPITAARIGAAIGAPQAGTFDLNAACSGFLTGLHVADGLIRGGVHKRILVCGGDVFQTILDFTDRSTCVLFGDGAGAVVLEALQDANPATDSMILASKLYTQFDETEALAVLGGGSRDPKRTPIITMDGKEVYKNAVRGMLQAAQEVLTQARVRPQDLRWVIPHQANLRIIEKVSELGGIPMDRIYVNLDRWGNTSAGTIAIALSEMDAKGLLNKGDLILLDAFGGGFTYGALLLRW
jgi:3-oxoacyl-[acyl-carrier-protein] synthase-3